MSKLIRPYGMKRKIHRVDEAICKYKVYFHSRTEALRIKRSMRANNKDVSDLHPYKCEVCKGYHLGSKQIKHRI